MSNDLLIGLIGISLTIMFGIYGVYTYLKTRKKVKLNFQNKECYSLFRDDVNRLNIEVNYNNKPFNAGLILLKARLTNNGQIDIDRQRVHNPINIVCDKNYKWLEARITFHPNGANTDIIINKENKVQINWDLLKSGEYIEIECLVEIIDNESDDEKAVNFYNGITFDFRITDLNTISKEVKDDFKFIIKTLISLTSISAVIGLSVILLFTFNLVNGDRHVQFLISGNKGLDSCTLTATSLNCINVISNKNNNTHIYNQNRFNSDIHIVKIIGVGEYTDFELIRFVIFTLIGTCASMIFIVYTIEKVRRYFTNKRKENSNKNRTKIIGNSYDGL